MSADVLTRLSATIRLRREADAGTSYTKQLLDAGPQKCARKFSEEAIETVIAAVAGSTDELTAEAADVVYHLLVLLEVRNVALADVLTVLDRRIGTSGLEEKARRTTSS